MNEEPNWTLKQRQIIEICQKNGHITRNHVNAFYASEAQANRLIDALIFFNYIIPDKNSIFEHRYPNGRVKEVCQKYLWNTAREQKTL